MPKRRACRASMACTPPSSRSPTLFGPQPHPRPGSGFGAGRAHPRGRLSVQSVTPARGGQWPALHMAIVSGLFLHHPNGCGWASITELLSASIRYGYMDGIAQCWRASCPSCSASPPTTAACCANSGSLRRLCSTAGLTDTAQGAGPLGLILLLKASSACPHSDRQSSYHAGRQSSPAWTASGVQVLGEIL